MSEIERAIRRAGRATGNDVVAMIEAGVKAGIEQAMRWPEMPASIPTGPITPNGWAPGTPVSIKDFRCVLHSRRGCEECGTVAQHDQDDMNTRPEGADQ